MPKVTLHGGYRDGRQIDVADGKRGLVLLPPMVHAFPAMPEPPEDWPKTPEIYDRRGDSDDFDYVRLVSWTEAGYPEKEDEDGRSET